MALQQELLSFAAYTRGRFVHTGCILRFRARKLPSNFNETKYIAFVMYIQLTTWDATITIFTSLWTGSWRTMLHYLVQLCSVYSFLLFIFTPKLYIILRHPEKDTPDFIKAAVTRNTMKRSFVSQSLPGLDWAVTSAEQPKISRSETLPTALSSNSVPASGAENKNRNGKRRAHGRVTWDSHMTINDVITEPGALNNLQKENGIITSTGQVEGNPWRKYQRRDKQCCSLQTWTSGY